MMPVKWFRGMDREGMWIHLLDTLMLIVDRL